MFSSAVETLNHYFKLWKSLGAENDYAFNLSIKTFNTNDKTDAWLNKYRNNICCDSAGIYMVDLNLKDVCDLPIGINGYETEEDIIEAF